MFTCWRQCLVGLINEYQWVTDWRLNGCTTECRMTERLTDWTSLFWAISRFFANFVLLLASTSVIKLLLWIIFSRGRFRAISRASPFFFRDDGSLLSIFLADTIGSGQMIVTSQLPPTTLSQSVLRSDQLSTWLHFFSCQDSRVPTKQSPRTSVTWILQGAAKCG